MPQSFPQSNGQTREIGRWRNGKGNKKKLRPLKQIEKDLEFEIIEAQTPVIGADNDPARPLSTVEQGCLAKLCLLPRAWISRSISVEYELRGVEMYNQFTRAIETIVKMEKKRTHPLLSRLKQMFQHSVEGQQSTYDDLTKAYCFLGQLTDILYGEKQKVPNQKK